MWSLGLEYNKRIEQGYWLFAFWVWWYVHMLSCIDDFCNIVLHEFMFRMLLGYISPLGITCIYVSWLLYFCIHWWRWLIGHQNVWFLSSWSASVIKNYIISTWCHFQAMHTGLFACCITPILVIKVLSQNLVVKTNPSENSVHPERNVSFLMNLCLHWQRVQK